MSEQNIYQEHYELQKSHANLTASLQNIYQMLFPHVAVEGVQLSLQEVVDLVLQKLNKVEDSVEAEVKEVVDEVTAKGSKMRKSQQIHGA